MLHAAAPETRTSERTLSLCNDFNIFLCHLWIQLVFDMLVLQKHNTEMTVAAGEALYTLVCLHQVSKQWQEPEETYWVAAGWLQLKTV